MSKSQPKIAELPSVKRREVMQLLDKGFHPDHLYYNGETILTYLSRDCGDAELPLYLLAKGANPKLKNGHGESALDLATSSKRGYLVDLYRIPDEQRTLQAAIEIDKAIEKVNQKNRPNSKVSNPETSGYKKNRITRYHPE